MRVSWLSLLLLAVLPARAADDAVTFDPTQARAIAPRSFVQDGVRVELGASIAVPVVQQGRTIGLGFVGVGDLTLTFAARADAERYANRQVLLGKRPVEELRGLAHRDAPLTTRVSRGFIFGSPSTLAGWLEGAPADGAEVARTLNPRLGQLDALFDLEKGAELDLPATRWLLSDFLGDARHRLVAPLVAGAPEADRWLTALRDEARGVVLATGRDGELRYQQHTVALTPWQEAARQDPGRDGVTTVDAKATVAVEVGPTDLFARLTVDTTLQLRVDRPVRALRLTLPRFDSSDESWKVTTLEWNGSPVQTVFDADAWLDLPPIPAGTEGALRVVYADTWRIGPEYAGSDDKTRVVVPRRVLPEVNGTSPLTSTIQVGLPAKAGLSVALSGLEVRAWDADGRRWVETRGDIRPDTTFVSFGEWATVTAPATAAIPALRVNLFRDAPGIAKIPAFLQAVVAYYQNLLPPVPTNELELLQLRDAHGSFTWTARRGLVTLQQMRVRGTTDIRTDAPHLEAEVMAHEVAHQWWGASVAPARPEDWWMAETLAETYACLFVGAAYGAEDCQVRLRSWRKVWEGPDSRSWDASLQDAWNAPEWREVAYEYGPYVILHMLRGRLGDEAFFGALDRYAAAHADRLATVDTLKEAFEATSGRDLDNFFGYWMVGGHLPRITLTMKDRVGTITSDIPFGTFDVPVAAIVNGAPDKRWVEVVDGVGTFELAARPSTIVLDGDNLVLARARVVR